jgi:hypothetical protein
MAQDAVLSLAKADETTRIFHACRRRPCEESAGSPLASPHGAAVYSPTHFLGDTQALRCVSCRRLAGYRGPGDRAVPANEQGGARLYRGAGTALESLPDMARRDASKRSHSALSGSDGMVTVSPWSRPARAASTKSSADITIAAGSSLLWCRCHAHSRDSRRFVANLPGLGVFDKPWSEVRQIPRAGMVTKSPGSPCVLNRPMPAHARDDSTPAHEVLTVLEPSTERTRAAKAWRRNGFSISSMPGSSRP